MANPYIQVHSTNAFVDATGAALASGTLLIQPVDASNTPIPFRVGSDGTSPNKQATKVAIQRTITNGTIDDALQLANPALTDPSNIGYTFTVTDNSSGVSTTYPSVLIVADGAGNWDIGALATGQYIKALPVTIVQGPAGVAGARGLDGAPGPNGAPGPSGSVDGTIINGSYYSNTRNFFAVQNNIMTQKNVPNGSNYDQTDFFDQTQRYGYGHSYGGGSWTVGKSAQFTYTSAIRGIHQGLFQSFTGLGIGDKAGHYINMSYVCGPTAGSDEGVTCFSGQAFEISGCYHGTVQSTTGTGDTHIFLNHSTTGSEYVFDGSILLNITKSAGVAGTQTGYSQQLENFLNYIPATCTAGGVGGQFPKITAWAVCADGPGFNQQYPSAYSQEITKTVTLKALPGGSTPALVNGHARLCGGANFEQVFLYNVQPPSGGTQVVTFKYRLPNPNFYLFQSPISDTYISYDAKRTFHGEEQLSTYCILGSLDGVSLLYAVVHTGTVGHTMPFGDGSGAGSCEAAGYDQDINGNRPWANFHLFSGAEVVGIPTTTDSLPNPEVENNRIAWAAGDQILCPLPASGGGGNVYWLKHYPQTPAKPGYAHANTVIQGGGNGVGGYYSFLSILNDNPGTMYYAQGGPLKKPSGMFIGTGGPDNVFRTGLTLGNAPDPIDVDGNAYAFGIPFESSYTNGREWVIMRLPYNNITYWLNNSTNNPTGDLGGVDNQRYVKFSSLHADVIRTFKVNTRGIDLTQQGATDDAVHIYKGRLRVDTQGSILVADGSGYNYGVDYDLTVKNQDGNNVLMHIRKGVIVGFN